MADPSDPGPKPGEKRSATDKVDSKRPLKLRRFDMKTRVSRPKSPESVASAGAGDVQETKLQEESTSGHGAGASNSTHGTMSVNMMFRTSLELQQAESCGSNKERRSSSYQSSADRNIVDKLFQDFVAIKMKEVDDSPIVQGLASLPMEEMNRLLDEEITSIKSRSVVSNLYDEDSEEANDTEVKQGDGDCDDSEAKNDGHFSDINSAQSIADGSAAISNSSDAFDIASQSELSCSKLSRVAESAADLGAFGHPSSDRGVKKTGEWAGGVTAVFEHPTTDSGAGDVPGGVKAVFGKKPQLGVRKLGLTIGQESLARILGNWKNGKILEDGEVASSTDSDAEKRSKAEECVDEGSEDSEKEVSETGSLSDSNEDKLGGHDSKSKKKKKHKHKHKKKKKRKSQNKEKDEKETDGHSGEGKLSKEKKIKAGEEQDERDEKKEKGQKEKRHSAEGKSSKGKEKSEEGKKESRSKDKKKHSRRRSRSNSRSKSSQKGKRSGSGSTSESHSKSDKWSKETFDPWDARSYRPDGVKSPLNSDSRHKDRPGGRRSHDRSRDRSRDRSKERSHRKTREHCSDGERRHGGPGDGHKDKRHSHHQGQDKDRTESSSDLRIRIDKNKLRKIAIARALANMEKGQGPSVDLTTVKSGGKSVAELTEFCKRISEKERDGGLYESSVSDSSEEGGPSEAEDVPLHHPFKMRDPSTLPNIVMNIRNAKQLPVLTPQEKQTQAAQLRSQFPVSSGTQHRIKESEWVPVTPTSTAPTTTKPKVTTAAAMTTLSSPSAAAAVAPVVGGGESDSRGPAASAGAPTELTVFPASQPDINIGSIITERIQAMRRLEENPFDVQALSSVHKMNEKANAWAQSKQLPGQFTGTTDVRILSQQELAGPDKRNQAWAKKDQFRRAPPVQGGIGMFLLQKMGWKPGDGLGKDNEGSREPLMLDVKMDRKGLATSQENRPQQTGRVLPTAPRAKDLSGKHPVSALTELCTKRRWGAPAFELINETGPPHKKMFLFKVRVNGVEYIPTANCANKKLAKAQAAAVCLQEMGLIPRDFVVQA